jgi:hypothetical protein
MRVVGFALRATTLARVLFSALRLQRELEPLSALRDFCSLMSYDPYGRYRLTSHFVETMALGQCDWFVREGVVGCEMSRK